MSAARHDGHRADETPTPSAASQQGASLEVAIATTANNFHLVRLLAAACVIYFHAFAVSNFRGTDFVTLLVHPTTNAGGLAVATFFWVSGLFVTQSWFRSRSWWDFAIRRVSRVWPALVACLVVTATLACLLSPQIGWRYFWSLPGYWTYIHRNARFDLAFFIPGAFSDHPNTAVNGSIHTLVLEVKMYVILLGLGLLGAMGTRARIAGAAGAGLLLSALRPDFLPSLLAAPSYGHVPIAMFFVGMACFAAAPWITLRGTALALGAGAALWFAPGMPSTIGAWTVIVCTVLAGGAFLPAPAWLRPHADLSYGVFLYGFPVQQCFRALFPAATPAQLAIVGLAGAALFAWASWHWLESPAIGRGKVLVHLLAARGTGDRPARLAGAVGRSAAILLGCLATTVTAVGLDHLVTRVNFWPVQPLPIRIVEYAPHATAPGRGFNVQSNGTSAMWFRLDAAAPPDTRVRVGDELVDTIVNPEGGVTCTVPDRFFAQAGVVPIVLERRTPGAIHRSAPVELVVTPDGG